MKGRAGTWRKYFTISFLLLMAAQCSRVTFSWTVVVQGVKSRSQGANAKMQVQRQHYFVHFTSVSLSYSYCHPFTSSLWLTSKPASIMSCTLSKAPYCVAFTMSKLLVSCSASFLPLGVGGAVCTCRHQGHIGQVRRTPHLVPPAAGVAVGRGVDGLAVRHHVRHPLEAGPGRVLHPHGVRQIWLLLQLGLEHPYQGL